MPTRLAFDVVLRETLRGVVVVVQRPVLIAVEAWPAIVATALAAHYRHQLLGRREIRELDVPELPPIALALAVALTAAYACTAVFALIVASERGVRLRDAWELVRPRLWLLAAVALVAASLETVVEAASAGESRATFLAVNGAAVAVQLTLLITVPLLVIGVRRRHRDPLRTKVGRYLLTAAVGLLISGVNLGLHSIGRALTNTTVLWWLGALAVVAALLLNVVAIAILRAVRAGASLT